MSQYYRPPIGQPRKELTKLQKAFFKVFTKYNPQLCDEYSHKPCKGWKNYKDVCAFYSIDLPNKVKKLPNKATLLNQYHNGHLWLETDVNPNGVTGKNDIARTYVIHVSFKGEIRLYRHRYSYDGEYAHTYVYGRTVDEAIEKFMKVWNDRIMPVFNNLPK